MHQHALVVGQSGRGREVKGWHTVWTACDCCSTPVLVPNNVIVQRMLKCSSFKTSSTDDLTLWFWG